MHDVPAAGAPPVAVGGASRLQVAERAAQLPAGWDELAGSGDLHQSTRYLRMVEATSGVPMRYLMHYRGNELDGALATALVLPGSPWLYCRTDTVLEFSARADLPSAAECLALLTDGRAVPRTIAEATRALTQQDASAPATELLMPGLVCGGRQFNRTRVLTREEGGDKPAVSAALVARAESVAADLGARSIAFLYVGEHDTELQRLLAERGYVSCVSAYYGVLRLPGGGFDAYKAMLAKRQRQSIAAERRKLKAAGVEVCAEPLTDDLIGSYAGLEEQLFAKHGGRWTAQQSATTLRAIMEEFGSDAVVFAARLDGALCGFTLALQHQDHWYVHRSGFEYALIGDLPVYFELGYNSVIEAAAASGVRLVHYGAGALRAKRLRGCTIEKFCTFARRIPGQRD
ncbi:MAG TPA: GNAT family N-acetyltransferase [Streptosporangiaceae bacterium]